MLVKLSRRTLLEQGAAAGAWAVVGTAGCGKETPKALSCTDTTGLSPGDLQVRSALAYVDYSTEPGKVCSKCQQFLETDAYLAHAPNACAACKVVKGPINPAGNCKSFVAKPI